MAEAHFNASLSANIPENYQRYFVPVIGKPLARDLIREARLKTGDRVLDVGCGTGVLTRLAATEVGSDGSVAGLDVNAGMLAVARSATPPELEITWIESSADTIPLPDDSIDVVLCQLSLQFFPDRQAALREMHRVLAPGGRVLLTVPGPADPIFETLSDAMRKHVSPQAAGFVQTVFALHDETQLEQLLKSAGFRNVTAEADTRELSLPAPKDFLWQYIGSTPLAPVVDGAGSQARSALENEVLPMWSRFVEDDGMKYSQRIVTASARR